MTLPTWRDYQPGDRDVCVWCHVTGCSVRSVTVEHLPVCPSVTGLWPVMPGDVGNTCCVPGCLTRFDLGDHYALIPADDDPDWSITVCVPCSLLRPDEAWKEDTE